MQPRTLRNWIILTAVVTLLWACLLGRVCFAQPAAVGAAHQDESGWTVWPANADVFYVSNSIGSDAYDGTSGTVDGGGVGPKQTIAAAAALLGDGDGDQLLFKRGDTWTNERFGDSIVSGADADNPTVLGAYGTGERPYIKTPAGEEFIRNVDPFSYIAIVGLRFEPNTRSITESPAGLYFNGLGDSMLVEDCRIEGYDENIMIRAPSGFDRTNLTLRRNFIANSWTSDSHSQGFYTPNITNLVIEENVFDHNGWAADWEDTAVLASGATAAYTNGDTLTITCVRYGAFTAADESSKVDLQLIDTNDASGAVDSVTMNGYAIQVSLDLTTGVASNTVATAIQNYNGGADFTCTSSGTANLVAADVGIQENFLSGGLSANPTIFNHNIYLSHEPRNILLRRNIFSRGSSMGTKINVDGGLITIVDNLYVRNGFVGHLGNALREGTTGVTLAVRNNVMIEPEARANNNGLGPVLVNVASGYFRNNLIGQKAVAEGEGGWAFMLAGETYSVGINNLTIDGNIMHDARGTTDFEEQVSATGNYFTNNIWAAPASATYELLIHDMISPNVMNFSGNQWYSIGDAADEWFTVDGSPVSTTNWQSTYEANADFTEPPFTDSTRTATSYATDVLMLADYEAFISALAAQRNGNYDAALTTAVINDYIRAGFDRPGAPFEEYDPGPFQTFIPGVLLQSP